MRSAQPLKVIAEHGIQRHAGNLPDCTCGTVADPQLDRGRSNVRERKQLAVRRPPRRSRARSRWQRHGLRLAIGNMNNLIAGRARSNPIAARSIVLAVIGGLDTNAGQPQEGRSYARNRGILLLSHEQYVFVRRADERPRRSRRMHHIQNRLVRLVVPGSRLRREIRSQNSRKSDRQREANEHRCTHRPCQKYWIE